jgi:hypothetical protein
MDMSDCRFQDYTRYYCLNLMHCCNGRVAECQYYDPPVPVTYSPEVMRVGIIMEKSWLETVAKGIGV